MLDCGEMRGKIPKIGTQGKRKKAQIDAKREGRHRSFLFEDPDPNFKLEKISNRERMNPTRVNATKK